MKILLATDGSAESMQAAEWLRHFPAPDDAQITVMSAVAPPVVLGVPAQERKELQQMLREFAEQAVADARRHLDMRWKGIEGTVVHEDPRTAIASLAHATRTDLIVVGSRGLGAVQSAVFGSVSLAVAHRASCSVLVGRGEPRPLRHVTVALDGSASARDALRFFERLPLALGVAIALVGVIQPHPYPGTMLEIDELQRAALESSLRTTAAELRHAYGLVDVVTPVGAPGPTIVEQATKAGSDLIVVGARGLGRVKRLVFGSVSEWVLRHAASPVLIVRRPA